MAIKGVKIEGTAEINANDIVCVCGHCNHHDREMATLEINFKQQKIFYTCGACKKMNELDLGEKNAVPYPRSRMG